MNWLETLLIHIYEGTFGNTKVTLTFVISITFVRTKVISITFVDYVPSYERSNNKVPSIRIKSVFFKSGHLLVPHSDPGFSHLVTFIRPLIGRELDHFQKS